MSARAYPDPDRNSKPGVKFLLPKEAAMLQTYKVTYARGAMGCLAFLALLTPAPSLAGEVDLEAAGCAKPPPPSRFMTVRLIVEADGSARDCVVSDKPSDFCQQYHSFDEGFLCLGLTRNPRPDITSAETVNSLRVDRFVVDGEEVLDDWGKSVLRRDLATGPSGGTYDVTVEHRFGERLYTLRVNVTTAPDSPVAFNSVQLTYDD